MNKKREKFIELAEKRVNKLINMIESISKLSNKNNYEYTEEDIREIFSAIDEELKIAKQKFNNSKGNKEFKLRRD